MFQSQDQVTRSSPMLMTNPIPSESIEIPNSEETPEVETTPSEETPEEPTEPEVTPEPTTEAELYELPDGRKVDGATLAKEWKDNFLPDYTRKSQELAAKSNQNLPTETPKVDPYADPNYVPQTYAEIIQAAKEAALTELAQKEEQKIAQTKAVEDAVIAQLDEVKKIDPNVDENKLFLHANKYGFRDLKTTYRNMRDMGQITKTVQKQTVENIAKRNDPVSVSPGSAVGVTPDPSAFSSAVDYMRSLKT